jgi:hypothetical protein
MTSNPRSPRHPGQDDRRDSRKLRTKTDPDRSGADRLPAAGPSNGSWKPSPE